MGWLIALVILFLLAILPLGGSVRYNADGLLVRVIAGPIRFTVFPMKKKKEKANKPKKKNKSKSKPSTDEAQSEDEPSKKSEKKDKQEKGGSITDFLPLVQVALDFLADFGRKLRVNRLELKLIMAANDPCDLGINYGRAWAAVGNLMPLLERIFVIKKRNVEVECDFTASDTLIIARLDLTITLGRIIYLAVRYGFRALWQYLQIKKLRKGGASK